jgi:ribonuclease D
MPPQMGYAELVARQLGHSIDKAQTRTDWSRRPLTPEQLAYAADDVHHLLQLHTELAAALAAKGREHWLAEEAGGLEDVSLYRTEPGEAWRRLKGIGRLRPREHAVARALAEWRERRAVASDRPRGWILSDEALLAIASIAPRSMADLEGIRALPPAVARKRGEELLGLVAAAIAGDDGDGVAEPMLRRPSPQENALVSKLQQTVRETATDLGVSPEVLATRRDVEALVFKDRGESAVLQGWRREVIGERLLAAMG